ncbi:hypothetical protein DSECCO2_573980 [anaerobic digester metagenome]
MGTKEGTGQFILGPYLGTELLAADQFFQVLEDGGLIFRGPSHIKLPDLLFSLFKISTKEFQQFRLLFLEIQE